MVSPKLLPKVLDEWKKMDADYADKAIAKMKRYSLIADQYSVPAHVVYHWLSTGARQYVMDYHRRARKDRSIELKARDRRRYYELTEEQKQKRYEKEKARRKEYMVATRFVRILNEWTDRIFADGQALSLEEICKSLRDFTTNHQQEREYLVSVLRLTETSPGLYTRAKQEENKEE